MSLIHYSTKHLDFRPKLKICLFPAPDRPLENVATPKIFFLRDLRWFVFFFGYWKPWPEVPILFQIYVRNWFTLWTQWTKSVARLWRNQICEWTQSILKKKKKSPYLPTHRGNGGAGNEHIIKLGLTKAIGKHGKIHGIY
jgi:hypothetical protein